jgi:hypothetical protein
MHAPPTLAHSPDSQVHRPQQAVGCLEALVERLQRAPSSKQAGQGRADRLRKSDSDAYFVTGAAL